MTEDKKEILLEAGTGELEILEFTVKGKHYAINVIKTKEIFAETNITKLPNISSSVAGLTLIRGDVIPLIDLYMVLEGEVKEDLSKSMTLLCEFNQQKVAFSVDKVLGIHRIGWNEIKDPELVIDNSSVIGNIILEDRILLLLDFEKIVMEINNTYGIYESKIKNIEYKERLGVKLILVDDSKMIRKMLKEVLIGAGYTNLIFFNDGEQAFKYLKNLTNYKGDKFIEDVQLLITDIEMPKMDGHSLVKKIKEDPILKKLPIIIFSSLITEDLIHKGEAVGADAQLSKPDIDNLVEVIESFVEKVK